MDYNYASNNDWQTRTPSPRYNNTPRSRPMTLKSNNPYSRFSMPVGLELGPMDRDRSRTQSVFFPDYQQQHHHHRSSHHPIEPKLKRRESTNPYVQGRSKSYRHSCMVAPDIVDRLDNVGGYQYHHEGPYDAVYPERNRISKRAPVEAVKESNEEALKATPPEKIRDALDKHRPLDGTAYFPPGSLDSGGRVYNYEEGSNMMSDYGNFHRLPGVKFTDEDFKNDPFYNRPLPRPFAALRKKVASRFRRGLRVKSQTA